MTRKTRWKKKDKNPCQVDHQSNNLYWCRHFFDQENGGKCHKYRGQVEHQAERGGRQVIQAQELRALRNKIRDKPQQNDQLPIIAAELPDLMLYLSLQEEREQDQESHEIA